MPNLQAVYENYWGHYLPHMILVGISNQTNRTRDLTTSEIEMRRGSSMQQETGGADKFTEFIEKELIPYIDNLYPTAPYRTLIGHSYAGLFTINALINHSHLFNNYIAIDPSLWWDDQVILKKAVTVFSESKFDKKSLYLGIANTMTDVMKIEDFVHELGVESYRNEIAEQREEFFNIGDPITPGGDIYEQLMERFKRKISKNIHKKKMLARITESFRLVYYDLVGDIMKQETQTIPCFGGISNVHLNYNGELWPCCVLGYKQPMGNLRQNGYEFKSIWHSKKAKQVRTYTKDKKCWCPLANQAYSNILCHPPSMLKVFGNLFRHM